MSHYDTKISYTKHTSYKYRSSVLLQWDYASFLQTDLWGAKFKRTRINEVENAIKVNPIKVISLSWRCEKQENSAKFVSTRARQYVNAQAHKTVMWPTRRPARAWSLQVRTKVQEPTAYNEFVLMISHMAFSPEAGPSAWPAAPEYQLVLCLCTKTYEQVDACPIWYCTLRVSSTWPNIWNTVHEASFGYSSSVLWCRAGRYLHTSYEM
jgi:hypothetical protein